MIKLKDILLENDLNEIFTINHKERLKQDLIGFIQKQFESGNITSIHAGISTVDYKSNDWVEPMADNLINHMVEYFETIRSQTEKDMTSSVPLEQD